MLSKVSHEKHAALVKRTVTVCGASCPKTPQALGISDQDAKGYAEYGILDDVGEAEDGTTRLYRVRDPYSIFYCDPVMMAIGLRFVESGFSLDDAFGAFTAYFITGEASDDRTRLLFCEAGVEDSEINALKVKLMPDLTIA